MSWFCFGFAFYLSFITDIILISLLPLTVDRFCAVTLPFFHKKHFTRTRASIALLVIAYLPVLVIFTADVLIYKWGITKLYYSTGYHRCRLIRPFRLNNIWTHLTFTIPFTILTLLYVLMFFSLLLQSLLLQSLLLQSTLTPSLRMLKVSATVVFTTLAI